MGHIRGPHDIGCQEIVKTDKNRLCFDSCGMHQVCSSTQCGLEKTFQRWYNGILSWIVSFRRTSVHWSRIYEACFTTVGSWVDFGILELAWKESCHQFIQKLWIGFEGGCQQRPFNSLFQRRPILCWWLRHVKEATESAIECRISQQQSLWNHKKEYRRGE